MSAGEVIALVSVVVTGGVSPWIASRLSRTTAEHATKLAREDELRSILSAAAIRLGESLAVFEEAESPEPLNAEQLKALRTEIVQLRQNQNVAAVRLSGDAPEVQHYRQATDHLEDARAYQEDRSTNDESLMEVKDVEAPRKLASREYEAFLNASSERVGPH